MKSMLGCVLAVLLMPVADPPALTGQAATIYRKASAGKYFATTATLAPEVVATSDGKSFYTVWRSGGAASTPARWIVSLPGMEGFATDDLAIWSRHLKGRDVGLVSLQWWLGVDNSTASYYTPEEMYREIVIALTRVGAQPGRVMFHGFSRGSANAYAIAAMDAGTGRKYFGLNVASSGGVALDYPPTRAILSGAYGTRPLEGTRWITSAGGKDPSPDRDGIAAMRRTSAWLAAQGAAVVMSIEDESTGHGALVLNPANARKVLDLFLE